MMTGRLWNVVHFSLNRLFVIICTKSNALFRTMKEKTHLKANRPRMPALVKREMNNEEGDDEDTSRMNYKGFDKAKLQSSRKAARKEKRMAKKQNKQQHQQTHAAEVQKLRRLKEENERLRKQLLNQSQGNKQQQQQQEEEQNKNKNKKKKKKRDRDTADQQESGQPRAKAAKLDKKMLPGEESADETAEASNTNSHDEEGEQAASRSGQGEQAASEAVSKYIPPHLRKQTTDEPDTKLKSAVKSCLNKVSELNISSITDEMERIYNSHPRVNVDKHVANIIVELAGEGSGRIIGQFAALYAVLVAALHASIGSSVGARFIDRIIREIDTCIADNNNLVGTNLTLLFGHLYVFKIISCSLVYDLVRVLLARVEENNLELLLSLLRVTGSHLRTDDPAALRDIIQSVRSKVSESGGATNLPPRARFLLDFIYDLQNNKHKRGSGAAAVAEEEVGRLKKWLRTFTSSRASGLGNVQQLRPAWEDIVKGRLRGPWWEQGVRLEPILMTKLSSSTSGQGGKAEGKEEEAFSKTKEKLLKLASSQQMGSDLRKSIFIIMMEAEDFMDACEKLLRLGLKEVQAREIVRVAFHCCGQEQGWNPFYALLLSQLCKIDKHHQFTLRLCFWDAFKEMDGWMEDGKWKNKIGNLGKLLAHTWSSSALRSSISSASLSSQSHLRSSAALCSALSHYPPSLLSHPPPALPLPALRSPS